MGERKENETGSLLKIRFLRRFNEDTGRREGRCEGGMFVYTNLYLLSSVSGSSSDVIQYFLSDSIFLSCSSEERERLKDKFKL